MLSLTVRSVALLLGVAITGGCDDTDVQEVPQQHPEQLLNVADQYMDQGRYAEALSIDSTSVQALHNMAIAHLEQGETATVVAALERAVRLAPESVSSLRLLASVRRDQG